MRGAAVTWNYTVLTCELKRELMASMTTCWLMLQLKFGIQRIISPLLLFLELIINRFQKTKTNKKCVNNSDPMKKKREKKNK